MHIKIEEFQPRLAQKRFPTLMLEKTDPNCVSMDIICSLSIWPMVMHHSTWVVLTLISPCILGPRAQHLITGRTPGEPPLIPYLVPFLGSAISYGVDPFKFFAECCQRVNVLHNNCSVEALIVEAWRRIYICALWPESYSLFRQTWARRCPPRNPQRCQLERDHGHIYHPNFWDGYRLRLSGSQICGTEEGDSTTAMLLTQ